MEESARTCTRWPTCARFRPSTGKVLNAAGNYYGHVGEMNTPEEQRKEAEERRRIEGWLTSSQTAERRDRKRRRHRDPQRPHKIDWECELGSLSASRRSM
jgi:hypothetical protein